MGFVVCHMFWLNIFHFLQGLLAAHRGGYMDSQKEEGPAPLLWRFSDFLKWAELCPSEPEIGHALMRLVITGQEIPHACEVWLLFEKCVFIEIFTFKKNL